MRLAKFRLELKNAPANLQVCDENEIIKSY